MSGSYSSVEEGRMRAWLSVIRELEGAGLEEVREEANKEKDPSDNEIPKADLDAKGSTFYFARRKHS